MVEPRTRERRRTGRAVAAIAAVLVFAVGCSSVEIVRLQPDILHTPRGTEPLAALQATCMGFYFFTLGLPEADLDKAVNELLIAEAKKIGADKLINLRFDVTPSHGFWFITKLLWFRVATAWAVAVIADSEDEEQGDDLGGPKHPGGSARPAESTPKEPAPEKPAPQSAPSSRPGSPGKVAE